MIVVPDDFPSVFEGSVAHDRLKKAGDVAVFTERGADNEQELVRRIGLTWGLPAENGMDLFGIKPRDVEIE